MATPTQHCSLNFARPVAFVAIYSWLKRVCRYIFLHTPTSLLQLITMTSSGVTSVEELTLRALYNLDLPFNGVIIQHALEEDIVDYLKSGTTPGCVDTGLDLYYK
jgi:hypothetical protein